MIPTYSPELSSRLIAEAKEDDTRMTALEGERRSPWRVVEAKGPRFSAQAALRHYVTCIPAEHPCWSSDEMTAWSRLGIWTSDGVTEKSFADGIARSRNNLRAMAEQLEAAQHEIERLAKERDAAEDECSARSEDVLTAEAAKERAEVSAVSARASRDTARVQLSAAQSVIAQLHAELTSLRREIERSAAQ